MTPSSGSLGRSAERSGNHVLCVFVSWQKEGPGREEGQMEVDGPGSWLERPSCWGFLSSGVAGGEFQPQTSCLSCF